MTTRLHVFTGRATAAAAPRPERRRRRRSESLELTDEQRTWLVGHGFGPDAPRRDFTDPAVRAELVQALRDCGALSAAPATEASPTPLAVRRVG